MLVLDRKVNEGFWIQDHIFVKVLGVGRRRVKLGIDAPGDMKIVREELRSHSSREAPEEGGPPPPEEHEQAGESFRPVRGRS